jgi:1,4-dihydroxy-2-naphthoate polyprenyltransferase
MSEAALGEAESRRFQWRVWWRLARPFSLTASIVPVLVGSAVAFATLRSIPAPHLLLEMLAASVLIQIATNMFNEYFDFKHGLDTPQTVGIAGAIVRGLVPPGTVFRVATACYIVAFLLGMHIVFTTHSLTVLLLGLASAAGGYFYTGGPKPIAYTPFGELEVFIFMGPVIVGLAYVIQAGAIAPSAIWASIPVACLVAAILIANNVRDVVADAGVGRRTLPVVFGRRAGLGVFIGLVTGAYIVTVIAVLLQLLPLTALLPVLTLTMPIQLVRLYTATEEPSRLNAGVRGSAALHARFGLLFALGIALGPLVGWQPPRF